jgi:hypothetical protein
MTPIDDFTNDFRVEFVNDLASDSTGDFVDELRI